MAVDYNILFQGRSPLEESVAGFQVGAGMRDLQMKREEAERTKAAQLQLQGDLVKLSSNPAAGASDYASMMTRYPQLSEHLKRAFETSDKAKQADMLSHSSQVYAAINSGRPDIASDLLAERAAALRNSGDEKNAKATETIAELIKTAPAQAKTSIGLMLSAAMGPDKFAETFTKLEGEQRAAQEQPQKIIKLTAEAKEHTAKAESAAVAARFAESKAVQELAKGGWDIKKIQEDIETLKANRKIAMLNVGIGQEANEIKRDELKLRRDETIQKRDEHIRGQAAEIQGARANMDNFLNTADRIIATPLSVKESALGPLSSKLPTTSQDTADFEALVENVQAQAFLSQVPAMKGLGALSDAEGKKLSDALQSFSLKQSPKRFDENVKEAQRIIQKARKTLATKYGVPDNVPDTPAAAAATTPQQVQDLINKYAPSVPAAGT